MAQSLQLSTSTEYNEIPLESRDLYVMATINAPDVEVERTPIDVTCVIDRSGSMAGDKMNLVKDTLTFMIDQLTDHDNLALIIFDDVIDTVLEFTKMTQENRTKAKDIVKKIRDRNSTNISDALYKALEVCKNRVAPNDVGSILLFTDGQANAGLTSSDQIVAGMDSLMTMNKPVSVFTFGFGSDHDANMLRSVAEAGNGLYYYVQKTDEIAQAFSDCLGGLLSVTAQNIKLRIDPLEGVNIKAIHSSSYKKLSDNEIRIGDLYSGESKDIIFEVTLSAVTSEQPHLQNIVVVNLSYYNVQNKKLDEVKVTASIQRSSAANTDKKNEQVDKQIIRVKQAEALLRSRIAADKGDYEGARNILNSQKAFLEESEYREGDYCQKMAFEMNDLISDMATPQLYAQQGNKKLNCNWSALSNQRSNAIDSEYATKSKKRMYKKYSENK
ncbi:inter-alpha-trypsin inhibitor heavy chain H3 [Acrasis kona]|uniref:Inter-alpha-trypsin inhibitor heavy chain H3 n=1 Tax=Acrasis kona TaxID=1008807 RepID=A0AAW2YTK0_9EUKA